MENWRFDLEEDLKTQKTHFTIKWVRIGILRLNRSIVRVVQRNDGVLSHRFGTFLCVGVDPGLLELHRVELISPYSLRSLLQ